MAQLIKGGKKDTGPWQSMINHYTTYMGVADGDRSFQYGGIPQKGDELWSRDLYGQFVIRGKSLQKPWKKWVFLGYNPQESLENTS